MKIIMCSDCGRWKYLNTDSNAVVWIKPTIAELDALEIILASKPLLISVGGYKQYECVCEECYQAKNN